MIKNNNETFELIQINLYKVLIGPVKNAFKIPIKNEKFIQVIFDLNISESLRIEAKVKSTELKFNGKFPG